ncbi:MAG: GDP-mannose 4,6-dehydratase, partial [Candidatus Eisenbacteria bacterium]
MAEGATTRKAPATAGLADARLLVTGGAGFIGSNFVRLALARWPRARVHVLDALTYAGNKRNLEEAVDPARLTFQHGDIRDPKAVAEAMEGVTHVVNFAAESMVDRSIDDPGGFVL